MSAHTSIRTTIGKVLAILVLLCVPADQAEARKSRVTHSIVKGVVGFVFDLFGNSVSGSSGPQANRDEVICSSLIEAQKELVLPYRIDDITVARSMVVDCDRRLVQFVKMVELTRFQLLHVAETNDIERVRQILAPPIFRAQCESVAGSSPEAVGDWAFVHDFVDNTQAHLFRITVALKDCPDIRPELEFVDSPATGGEPLAFAPQSHASADAPRSNQAAPTTGSTSPHLSEQEVKDVQAALKWLNYYLAPVDGVLGPQTMRAIRMYERDSDLPETGSISPALWSRLNSSIRQAKGALQGQSTYDTTTLGVRCIPKPVMRDVDYLACGVAPPE